MGDVSLVTLGANDPPQPADGGTPPPTLFVLDGGAYPALPVTAGDQLTLLRLAIDGEALSLLRARALRTVAGPAGWAALESAKVGVTPADVDELGRVSLRMVLGLDPTGGGARAQRTAPPTRA
jgi:hypothetical protein